MKRVALVLMLIVCVVRGDDLPRRIEDAVEALERGVEGDEKSLEGDEQQQALEERGVDKEIYQKRGVYYLQAEFDEFQSFACNPRMALHVMMSNHIDKYEDRLWSLACKPDGLSGKRYCSWTDWVNKLTKFSNFDCPHAGYIAGMRSKHVNAREDRIYKFHCCHLSGSKCHRECRNTRYSNWDAPIRFAAPKKTLITGVQSYFNIYKKDRRFKFTTCKIQSC